jgi:hypothetical protein
MANAAPSPVGFGASFIFFVLALCFFIIRKGGVYRYKVYDVFIAPQKCGWNEAWEAKPT